MDLPHNYQKKFPSDSAANETGLPRSAWEEQLGNFAEKVNPSRVQKGLRPYSYPCIALRLNERGIRDPKSAYIFFRKLESEARNFPALFEKLTKGRDRASRPSFHLD